MEIKPGMKVKVKSDFGAGVEAAFNNCVGVVVDVDGLFIVVGFDQEFDLGPEWRVTDGYFYPEELEVLNENYPER
jgi:hypothetical protein